VAGDAMDLTLLGAALVSTTNKSNRGRLALATTAVAGLSALDVLCTRDLTSNASSRKAVTHFEKSVTINRSPEELYNFWHNFDQLPNFMGHLESVKTMADGRSHWVAKGPAGTSVEWDAEVIRDIPNQVIAWRSLEGSQVDTAGEVRFEPAPGGRGTTVRVSMDYHPPGGWFGARVAGLFGEAPEKQVAVDLRRFKQLMETGEIVLTEGQPAGRASSTSKKYDDLVRS